MLDNGKTPTYIKLYEVGATGSGQTARFVLSVC